MNRDLDPDAAVDRRLVMVVHGRNEVARKAMFDFLRALHLDPLEWSSLVARVGSASPFIGEVVDHGVRTAAAVVVLLTAEDEARVRPPWVSPHDPDHERNLTPQARPNVLFEAGMAFGLHPERTVIVELGDLRPFSDVAGRHVVRIDGTERPLRDIARRLQTVGCAVDMSGDDWASPGRFDAAFAADDGRAAEPTDGGWSALADLVAGRKSSLISEYPDLGWGDALTLVHHPELRLGWALDEVRIAREPMRFVMPAEHVADYEHWVEEQWEVERLYDDRPKYMALENPIASTDSPTLTLRLGETRYSEALFYHHRRGLAAHYKRPMVKRLVHGDLGAEFTHSLCMHAVLVSSDGQLLLTERSRKVGYGAGLWSASCEESLAEDDFANGTGGMALRWARRLLYEEVGLDASTCDPDNMRLLSVFLEAELPNISLCVGIRLDLTAKELETRIRAGIRSDTELSNLAFLPATPEALTAQLTQPAYPLHATSGYRLLMVLLWLHGPEALDG